MAAALHIKLLTDISDMMETDSQEFNNFVFNMTQFVAKGLLNNKRNLLDKFAAMKSKGKLDIGKYDNIKKVAKDSGNVDVLELIQERELEILEALACEKGGKTYGPSTSVTDNGQSTSIAPSGQSRSDNTHPDQSKSDIHRVNTDIKSGTGNVDIKDKNVKKRKLEEETDQSDPLYGHDERGRGKYDTDGKKGYLLILNYERGLGNDVKNLESFFGTKLGFEVKTISGNLTRHEMLTGLNDARKILNEDTKRTYYAFICVILSHGNEKGIQLKDGETIFVDDIRKHFSNSSLMKNFTGRPKLFFVQSCRGNEAQDLHEVDEDDYEKEDDIDESDEIFRVPTDADTLIAYANTQGYATFGDSADSSTQFTCFINALLTIFKRFYSRDHVEEMLISVREMVALGEKKYYHAGKCKQTKQMPCVWSTLTKRLYLTGSQTPMDQS